MDHPAVRVVRPRPLGLNDRIPVFWAGQEPTQELKQIDGGALYRHLVAASTPKGDKKRKRPHKYQAPKEVSRQCTGLSFACPTAAGQKFRVSKFKHCHGAQLADRAPGCNCLILRVFAVFCLCAGCTT